MAMEGSCSNSSANCNGSICSWMGFGGNSGSGVCPTMMMPLVTSNHAGHYPINPNLNNPNHPNPNQHTNSLFPMPFTTINNNNNNNDHYPNPNRNCNSSDNNMLENNHNHNMTNSTGLGYFMEINHNNNDGSSSSSSSSSAVKAKIMGHPHYHRLLAAYVNCQKVGAPPEVVARLEEACASAAGGGTGTGCSIGEDPALDQFMEAYCEMLNKYQQELSKPFNEATLFLQRIESQFKSLTLSSSDFGCEAGRNNGSAEDVDGNNNMIDPEAEDQELKVQLLRKYSGYLGSLKQEFMKKRKKGKLPKEARQQLLEWWSRHYKWPYPSESQKLALAEATGLDQKQINNWFINQRKRHWKPSEDMQFVVVDPSHPHYYMDTVLANPFPMDLSHTML